MNDNIVCPKCGKILLDLIDYDTNDEPTVLGLDGYNLNGTMICWDCWFEIQDSNYRHQEQALA
jgi:hypothetical protein